MQECVTGNRQQINSQSFKEIARDKLMKNGYYSKSKCY